MLRKSKWICNGINRLARLSSHLKFLNQCITNNVFPPTIQNLHFPTLLREEHHFLHDLQLKILIRMKRKLYSQRANQYKRNEKATDILRSSCHPLLFQNILEIANKEFQRQSSISNGIHQSKLYRIIQRHVHSSGHTSSQPRPRSLSSAVQQDRFVNKTDIVLSEEESSLLSKGPKFIPSSVVNESIIIDFKSGFQKLVNQVRWRCTSVNPSNTVPFIKCPAYQEIKTPPLVPNVEKILQLVSSNYSNVLRRINRMKVPSNLSKKELSAISSLRKKSIVILPTDKGGNFCVSSCVSYDEAVLQHLQNSSHYRRISFVNCQVVEDKINRVWKEICHRRMLPKQVENHYISSWCRIPTFKGLLKTHKADNPTKIRPIVNNIDSPTYKITWLLQKILQKFSKDSRHSVASCSTMFNKLESLPSDMLRTNCYPFSLDAKDMFSSIPPNEAIEIVFQKLTTVNFSYYNILPVDVKVLLQVIFDNSFFRYKKFYFKQTHGLPMGNKLSGLLADIFMDKLENSLIDRLLIPFYSRYVDDCLLIVKDRDQASNIHDNFNAAHSTLKFEIEHPGNNCNISLLDFTMTINNGKVGFEPYTKPARSSVMFHGTTALPTIMKNNVIQNEWFRIKDKCSGKVQLKNAKASYLKKLQENGHHWSIKNLKNSRPRHHSFEEDPLYLSVPFINDMSNTLIKRALKPLGLPVRLVHKGKTLQSLLSPTTFITPTRSGRCDLKNCPLQNQLCYKKMVVYEIRCCNCQATYIGSTKKFFHERMKEHNILKNSSIYKHRTCSTNLSYRILAFGRSVADMRLKEAIIIREKQPCLNVKEDLFSLSKISLI